MPNFDFKDQNVLITGGTRGIGASLTRAFLSAGASVIATYRSNHDAAMAFSQSLGEESSRLECVACDVTDVEAVDSLYARLDETELKLDILINNGGIRRDAVAAMMSASDWKDVIDTNLTGAFLMSKQAIKNMMRQRYGRIINISSPMSREAFAGQSNYSASKGGLESMTRSMCKEVGSRKITVNCVSPGFIETELIDDLDEETVKTYKKMVPVRRFGKPEEVADAVLFLGDKSSGYISGSVLEISGGL
jgi:3-oxoacyl-[acyl-carrier protein] reductase